MKKTFVTVLLLLSLICLVCCGGGATSDEAGMTQESPAPSETKTCSSTLKETPDGEISFTLDNEVLNVSLCLEEKNAEVSALLLPDREAAKTWRDDPSVVIDIDQASTDDNGRAEVRLTLPEDCPKAILVVTVGDRVCEREVR